MTIVISVLIVIAAIVTFALSYSSIYHKKRARVQEKVPVSPVGEIEESGVAKVVGKVVPLDKTLQSPLSKVKCVYYRITIEELSQRENSSSGYGRRRGSQDDDDDDGDWETVVDDAKSVAFAVEDDTGMATVQPKHLDVEVRSRRRIDSGYLKSLSENQERHLNERYPDKKFSFTKKMRFKEVVIEIGDKLAVTGDVDLPKDDHPRFRASADDPIVLSDETENPAAAQSYAKAKTSLIFTGVSGACTLGLIIWLVVVLASSKKTSGANSSDVAGKSNDSTTAANTSVNPQNDNVRQPENNPPQDNKRPKKKRPRDNNPVEPFDPPAKNDPPFERPQNDGPLPVGNDIDSVIARYKAKVEKNDVFGSADELRLLAGMFKPDHPKRVEILNMLMVNAQLDNVFIKGEAWKNAMIWVVPADSFTLSKFLATEMDRGRLRDIILKLTTFASNKEQVSKRAEIFNALLDFFDTTKDARNDALKAACQWSSKDDVPKLCEILVSCHDGFIESTILASLKEHKDPRSAESVALFLLNFGKKREAQEVLRAIGPAAEKAVHPYTSAMAPGGKKQTVFNRTSAIEVLGDIGTQVSVPLLRQLAAERPPVKNAAETALKKIELRGK